MEVVIKAFLQEAGAPVEVRRILISMPSQGNKGIFKETFAKVGNTFPALADKIFSLKWKDSDGDLVMMSSDEEMNEALAQAQNSPLKIYITVAGVKDAMPGNVEDVQADASQEAGTDDKKESDHQKGDPFSGPFESGFCDPMSFFGMRKRGHPDSHNPRGHFSFNFGGHMGPRGQHFEHLGPRGHHFGHMGPRGHHFEHLGPRGHHFVHMGPRGHHFGHMGPRGQHFDHANLRGHPGLRGAHHFGNHMGMMHGPFGGSDSFEGPPCYQFQGVDVHFGQPFIPRHHHHEENGWKAKLRDAVPVAHRRWAKTYIRTWRVQNLKNATSTSGDSDQEILTMETASIPEAYAAWLDIFLPKWHKRQGQEGASTNINKEKDAERKSKLKASVPLEFRKWAKWYLARHFGKKEAPKFRKECPFEGNLEKLRKKDWKKSFKMQTLAMSIPSEHRLWVRAFIRDWRQEHKVPDLKAGDIFSESEATEKTSADGGVSLPDDYAKWMHKFLAKWHLMRGQVDEQNVQFEVGHKGEFKDTVPKHFRKWVKCYMWRQYGKGAVQEEGNTPCQYEKWLKAFQKKWLKEQAKKGSADEFVLTSSDDDDATGLFSDEAEQAMDSSMKKLRLHQEKANRATEGDNGESEVCSDWLKQALWQWDGMTAPGSAHEGADTEQISPYLYRWMSKMMMKKQKKMMKKEFKQAKHSMKAALKAHKYGHQF